MNYDEQDEPMPSDESKDSITVSPTTVTYEARAVFDSVVRTVSHTITNNIESAVHKEVMQQASEKIGEKVGALIDSAIEAGIQPVNSYGEPIGERTTLKAMIGKQGNAYLAEKVDKHGNKTTYSPTGTRLEFMVAKAVEEHIDHQLKTAIKKAVDLATVQATEKVGDVIAQMLLKLGK